MKEGFRPVDYHTQTIEHGLEKPRLVRETVQAAISVGLSTICLTDHYPLPPTFIDPTDEKDCAMPMADYPVYQEEVRQAMDEFGGQISVRRGAEIDWLPDYADWTREQISNWPFDYVIGSVHFLGKIDDAEGERNYLLDYKESEFLNGVEYFRGIEPLGRAYFQEVRRMVGSGLFDGVGHIDLIKKYNDGSLFSGSEDWYREEVIETLDAVSAAGMSMEINSAGLDKKCQEIYPSPWILRAAHERNIPITIGSDGHTPEGIGRNLERAIEAAKAAGYDQIVEYRQHQKIPLAI
ncbi:MAG: histidinol-phosphatase HisJ [Candidatus Levyibacteriota bacterium]